MSGIKNNVRRTRKRISDSKKVLMILGLLINTMTAVADDSIKETQGFGTKVEKQGNVYDITTNKIKDKNAFNSFDKFHLEQNNIANMHFGSKGGKEAENLFNFVKGKIEVNGVINGIRDNKIGGNLYFLSSEGLLVGKTGVINAGTFRAISPKKEEYEKAFKDAQNSKVFDGIVPQQDGSIKISLNPNGSITVEGKINAVDEIGLYAADIKLPETGALKTGVTDFHQLVNIKDSNVNAGLSGDLKATKTGTGDIILSAKVEEAGHELESSTIYEQIGRNFKGKIKANIETSGSIEAEGHAKIHAEASNGKLTKKDGEKEVYAPEFSLAEVEASVKVNKGKIKGKKVDISAEAKNYYDTPILTKVGKIAFSVGTGSLSPINMNGALGLLKSKASVFIGKDATVESTEGEANIRSYSGVRASMGASTSPIKLTDLYLKTLEGKLPSVGAAYISTSSESDVTVEGKVSSKEKANITSKSENTIDASVSVGTIRDSNKVGISVLVTEGKNHSSVKIAEGAKVESDGDANVKSEAVNSIRAAVKSGLSDNGAGVVAANISNYNSSSKVVVDGEVHAKKRLNTEAYNITKQNVLQTGTKTGTSKLMNELVFESSHTKALIDALQYRFGGDEKIKSKLTDLFSVGASATVANHNNTSSVSLGQKSKLVSGVEGTNIKALTETQQLRSTTTSGSLATRGEEKKKLVGNAAVFYGNYKNDASVTIADDAQVVSEGKIDTISENKLEYKNPSKMAEEVVEKLEILKRAFEKEKKDETTFDPKDIDSMKKLLTEFSKKLDDKPEILLNGEKITIVLPDGTSKTGTVPELAEYVKEEMKKLEAKLPTGFKAFSEGLSGLLKESLAFTGVGNYANFHTFTSAGTNAKRDTSSVGGAVSWVEMDNHSKVSIGRGSKITAKGDLNVKAINKTETVNLVGKLGLSKSSDSATAVGGGLNVQKSNTSSIVVTKEKAELSGENIHTNAFNNVFHVAASLNAGTGGNGINGMGSYSGGSSKSRVSIDDETHLKAKKKIYLDSENNTSVTNVAGAVAIGSKNAAVGAAVAINDYDISNKVSIEDNDTEDGGKSKYDKNKEEVTVTAEDLHANAKTTGTINAVSVAGGISKVGEAESDGTGIFSKIGNKVDSVKGKITDAIGFVTDQVTNYVYRGSNGTEDGIPNISKESSKLPSFSLGASGSVSVNNIKKETSAVMDGVKISLSGANKEVGVTSSDSTFVGAWSGSAALQWNHIGSGNSNFSASLAGAAAANNIQSKTNAVVKNSSIQNANKFKVNALSGGTQVAAGAGLEAAKESGGQGKSYLLGTSASINLVDNEVSAKSENNIVEGESENKKMNVDVTAYEADTQVTGALDLQAGKSSGTAGAAITVAKLNNKVNASISGGKYTKVNRADAKALLATTQVTAAVATGGTISSGAGLGNYQGVVSVNKIDNDVEAGIDKSSIEGADEVNVIAKDVKGSSNLAKEYQALLNGKDEKYLKDRGIDTTGNGYYTKEQLEEAKKKEGAVIVNAALSVAGTDKSAGGVAIAVNTVKNKFKAELNGKDKEVEEGKIRAKHVNVEAKSSTVVVNAASGLAVSKDAFSGMGSGAWQDLSNETVAKVNKGRISTDSLNVTANNSVLGVNVAGTIAGSLSTAVGAAFANNTLHNKTSALITETKVNSFSGKDTKINAQALNDSHITNVSAGVAASVKQVGIGGMVSVNRGSDETEALVSDSEFDGVNSVDVRAEDKKVLNTIAGNINGGQAAGVGATVAHTNIGKQSVTAAIKNSKITTAKNQDKKNINVTAKDSVVMNTVAAGVGGAKGASVQGSSASTTLNKTVSAHVEKTDIDKENHESKEKADFNVLAENTSQVVTNATVLAGASGQAAVGAGVAVNKITQNTSAHIKNSTQNVRNALLKSKANSSIKTIGIGAGVGVGGVGVSGSVAVNKITNNNTAVVEHSDIFAKGNIGVIAESDAVIANYAGTVSGGGHVGVGGSTGVNEIEGDTIASVKKSKLEAKEETEDVIETQGKVKEVVENVLQDIGINDDLSKKREKSNKKGFVVNSSSTHTIKSLLANAAGAGKAAVAGTVNVNKITGETKALVESSVLNVKNSSIHAGDYTNSIGAVGSASGALNAGIGASSNTNLFSRNTKTIVHDTKISTEKEGQSSEITANSKQGISSFGVGVGAGVVGAGVAGTVSVNKLSGKTEVDIQKSDISTKSADISAKHYGVLSTGNGSVGAAVKGAGVGAAVAVTKDLTNTNVRIKDSKIVTKTKLDVIAQNHTKVNGGMVGIGAAGVGAGLAGTVSVNNITSKVGTEIDHSELLSEEDVNVKALNKVDSSMMAAGGAAGLGAASGVVSVNTVNTSVVTRVHNNSKITSSKGSTNVKAEEEKNIKQVVANAVAGGVSVGANVLVNNFGTAVEDKAAETGKGTEILKTLEEINKDQDQKISEDAAKILKSNGIDTKDYAVKADRGETQAEGIKVFVENSSIKGKNTNIAANQTDNVTSTGGAGSAGVASALGTVGVTNIKRNIGVFINNADVKADEKLSVRSDISGNVSLTSYQGTVGALGLGAAYSQINANGQSNITIKNSRFAAKHIDVIAKDKSQLKAEAKGLTVGAVAAGAIISKANNEMNSEIEIEKSIFNEENRVSSPSKGIGREINVKVEKENRVTAESQGASVGAVAGAGIISDAKDAGNSYLKVSTKSGRSIFHADNVNMEATHKMKVTAGSKAVTGSVLGGVGVTKAEATSAGKVMVEIEEGNLFRTNRLNAISKVEGLDEDKVTAKSFVVSGNGGGIAGAGVNTSTAQSNTESVVRLRKQDYENNDSTKKYISEVNALAVNDTKNEANIESLEVAGVYAQGTNKAFTKSDKLTSTTVNGGKVYQLRAKALAKNENYGNVKGSGGALVGAETAAVENYVKSTTGASVAGEWEIGDKLETIAKDNTIVKVNGDGTKGGLVGKNGISVKNTILGETKSFIDDKAKIAGTGSVNVEALNELDVDLQGKSGGYGGIGVGNVDISNVIKKDTEAKIGQHAVVETTGKQEYQAFTKAKVNILGKGDAAAAAAISNVHVSNEMDIKNLAKQYAYSQLTTKNSKNDITLASSSELDVNVHGVAEAKGVGAKATSSVKNQINRANNVDLAGKIKTEGNINVYAGYDKNYNISKTNSKAIADAKSHAAAASATATIEKNEVKFNNAIREFKNNLAKLEGKVNKEVSTGLNQVDWYTDKYTWHSSEKAYKKLTYQSKKGEKNKK
ncbi:leukotoxin LktA family filamentous adhesin [Fusobacterium necrophorum]|uniref:leukotoxin LktA family filamentous adhesin n=1 Tax=Fusobacterium necrophorum TaxID=859 RepID=UPI000788C1F4|nr:leukotoxin LktA family filamentous adhesin [Fusobacterium necrophorum]AYV94547.1 leukotoxin LktA family filamentous adhesin [Fusobacterium necrophorum subsp. funduliforme]KYL04103.1 leukotoxin [Fusobacterium necrophorum subsp. funduliforme]